MSRSPDAIAAFAGWLRDGFAALGGADVAAGDARALLEGLHRILLLRLCEDHGLEPARSLRALAAKGPLGPALAAAFTAAAARHGRIFACAPPPAFHDRARALAEVIADLYSPAMSLHAANAPALLPGQAYEQGLGYCGPSSARKAGGVFYTPVAVADALLAHTLGELLAGCVRDRALDALARVRVLDPSCGAGVFLVRACDLIAAARAEILAARPASEQHGRVVRTADGWRATPAERARVLATSIHGVDQDPYALELARFCLRLPARPADHPAAPASGHTAALAPDACGENLVCADALACGQARGAGLAGDAAGYDVVVGNPPWGQKDLHITAAWKDQVRRAYPSARGIFDWFRPFVELGVRLTRPGGHFGMVLPDIVLLKNYEPTRRFLLAELALTRIEWLGDAFPGAIIDACTIAGRRAAPDPGHRVHIVVHDRSAPLEHALEQADFSGNPRAVFNLSLTRDRRAAIERLRGLPRLGDHFEVHEGVHSGNMRAELFVHQALDDSCRELLFGRDELRPYSLVWSGRYVRLSARPERQTRARNAHLGRMEWYLAPKLLVRRTGDRVVAAVDEHGRFASNNFFLVLARHSHPLTLHGLCALLCSRFMTWYFRVVEPRRGRAFAELKIKHLVDFPLPARASECQALDELGRARAALARDASEARVRELDTAIDQTVCRALDLGPEQI